MDNWIPEAVIYQINLRSLAAREPRNAFEAATEQPLAESPLAYVRRGLPHIRALGANVLYLMPPYPIGVAGRKGIGSPYAIRDFRAIEPEYGTMEDMTDLVREAHRLGLKVIFDLTPNHTARDHVWMAGRPDFYVKNPDGSVFHDCDWTDTAKLDYTQPALRREMVDVYDAWLEFLGRDRQGLSDGIDGFRLDMAHFINDRGFWDEAVAELQEEHIGRDLLFLAECYGRDNNLDLFRRGINAAYDDDFFKVATQLYGVDEQGETRIVPAPGIEHDGGFRDRYDAFRSGGLAGAFRRALLNYEEAGLDALGPWLARYTDNHDEGRGLYLMGDGAVRAVNQLVFLAPRTLPFLLTGQEFGALNRPSIHDRLTPIGKKRRVVQPNGTVREVDAVEFEGNLFARGHARRQAWHHFYRELITLRKSQPALTRGSFTLLEVGEDAPADEQTVLAFERRLGHQVLRCAVNLGPTPRRLTRSACLDGTALLGEFQDRTLPAFGCIVLQT